MHACVCYFELFHLDTDKPNAVCGDCQTRSEFFCDSTETGFLDT